MSVQQREKNLAELDKRYPGIKQLVEDRRDELLAEEKCAVTEERSYIGETILKVRMEGKELYLAGKRNPIGPVANQLNLLGKIVPNAPVLIVGMGNIRYLEEVLSRTDASVLVLLYEPSFSVFDRQLELIDVERIWKKRTILLLVEGINADGLESAMRTLLVRDRIPLMKSFYLPNYEIFCAEKLRDFYRLMKKLTEPFAINLNTMIKFVEVAAENFYHNVEYLRKGFRAGQLDKAFPQGMPAIVISAGPSLNNNIQELKRAKNRAFLIATDTAMKPLLKKGIVPDMYAMLDGKKPLKLVAVEEARSIPLLTLVTGAKEILDFHTGKKFFVNENYLYIQEMFDMHHQKLERLQYGGSVATLAFSLACHLAFSPIIFVGQDLAYTGNKSHADGTFQDKMETVDTSKYLMVPGNYEEQVPTRTDYNSYRIWFEEFISSWTKRYHTRFINATEGGARIEGTELMSLREAIDTFCTREADIAACIEQLEPTFNEEEQKALLTYFHDTPKVIHKIVILAEEGEKIYRKLDRLCRNGNMDKTAYLKLLKRVRRNRKSIEGNPHYQIISETMVRAEQIIQSSQYFRYDTIEEEGMELARQGRLYMRLLKECALGIEQIAEKNLGGLV